MRAGFPYRPYFGRLPTRAIKAGASAPATNITPSVDVSRTSGVAPLAIHFDASATTAAAYTSRPFHDLEYRYDFGDEAVSTWTYGAQPSTLLKNIAYGSTAAHVYESAGTFNPTVTIRYRLVDGSYDSVTYSLPSITVTAADTEWATTKTYTYSTNTDHTGAPSGSIPVSNVTDIAASIEANLGSGNRRHLLRAGQTFSAPTNFLVNVGGGANMVGKFGSGAKPIWNRTASVIVCTFGEDTKPTQVSDWRFVDIVFEGSGYDASCFSAAGHCDKMLVLRCDIQNIRYGYLLSQAILDGLNTGKTIGDPDHHAMWDEMYVFDSTIYNLTVGSGPVGIFASAYRMAVIGCSVDNNGGGEHGIRTQYVDRSVFSNNTVEGIPSGKANLTIRGGLFGGTTTLPAGSYTEKNVVSDNHFIGGLSGGMIGFGPQSPSFAERGRNMIVERNLFETSTANVNTITCEQPDMTFRNNVFIMQAGLALAVIRSDLVPFPERVSFHNNSIYSSQTGQLFVVFCAVNHADWADVDPGDVTINVYNNLAYAPSASSTSKMMGDPYSTATYSSSNNSSDSQIRLTSPNFTTTPPTTIAHFKPTSGYAVAGGIAVAGVYRDILGVATPTTPVIGAVED